VYPDDRRVLDRRTSSLTGTANTWKQVCVPPSQARAARTTTWKIGYRSVESCRASAEPLHRAEQAKQLVAAVPWDPVVNAELTTVRADAAGPVERRSHGYVRHAASTPFAALETAIGKILKKADRKDRSNAAR
jgi:hypothetical protein